MTATKLPNAAGDEQRLLSCCFLDDGLSAVRQCIEYGITPEMFSVDENRTIWLAILKAYERGGVDSGGVMSILISEGNTSLAPKVAEIIGSGITSLHLSTYIANIAEAYSKRHVLMACIAVQNALSDPSVSADEAIASLQQRLSSPIVTYNSEARPITSFHVMPLNDESVLLGERYICRGHSSIWVSSAGMGKSSLSIQTAILWALGKPAFGIMPAKPLKSVIIQAEDDDGDIGEVWESVRNMMDLTEEDKKVLTKMVLVISDKVSTGDLFLKRVAALGQKHNPDLFWINPLHSFFGSDITDAEAIANFCRKGLSIANPKNHWAWILIHHTTKPKKDVRASAQWSDVMYDMAGSADLINWSRSVTILKALEKPGDFDLVLAKRGKRAGIVEQKDDGSWEIITTVPLQHCRKFIKVPNREKEMSAIFWEPRIVSAETQEKPEGRQLKAPVLDKEIYLMGVLDRFPKYTDPAQPMEQMFRSAKTSFGIPRSTFKNITEELLAMRYISCDVEGARRTQKGENALDNHKKSQP